MTYWVVSTAQVVGGKRYDGWSVCLQRLCSGWMKLCSGCMFYDTSCSCQGKYQTMEWAITTKRVTPESCYKVNLLSHLPPPFDFFFPSDESKTAWTQCCSPRPSAGSLAGVNWDNCVVWSWATAMPVLSYHGVTGWHTDSTELLQGAVGGNVSWHSTEAIILGGLPSWWIRCVVFCQQLLLY